MFGGDSNAGRGVGKVSGMPYLVVAGMGKAGDVVSRSRDN